MRVSEIVKMDSKGRILLPSSIRDTLGLSEGMSFLLIAELKTKEIRVLPFADHGAKLSELRVRLRDEPGALANVAAILASKGVDLLWSQSRTLRRGESAEWHAIMDVSKCPLGPGELKALLEREGKAEVISCGPIST
ncbi:MAG: AbrB family transcriptional regulator [Candidatus Bathyarchaeia archaeon]